jgi:hypothetical protein
LRDKDRTTYAINTIGTAIQPKQMAETRPTAAKISSGNSFLKETSLNLNAIIGSVEAIK